MESIVSLNCNNVTPLARESEYKNENREVKAIIVRVVHHAVMPTIYGLKPLLSQLNHLTFRIPNEKWIQNSKAFVGLLYCE